MIYNPLKTLEEASAVDDPKEQMRLLKETSKGVFLVMKFMEKEGGDTVEKEGKEVVERLLSMIKQVEQTGRVVEVEERVFENINRIVRDKRLRGVLANREETREERNRTLFDFASGKSSDSATLIKKSRNEEI